jgi:hypothetical protein
VLNKSLRLQPYYAAIIVSALARDEKAIAIRFGKLGLTRALSESLRSSGLSHLLWPDIPQECDQDSSGLFIRKSKFDPGNQSVSAHPSFFDCTDRERYQLDLGKKLRFAGIPGIGTHLFAAGAIGFEVNTNAEEHGCVRVDSSRETYRAVLAFYRREITEVQSPDASTFLLAYKKSGHSLNTGWLELIVVDSGMGVVYPSYHVSLHGVKRKTDIYHDSPADERGRLGLVLNRTLSTKGEWGRIVNTQTAVGEGIKLLKIRLAPVRGYAGVRAGRCGAYWGFPEMLFGPAQRSRLIPYDLLPSDYPLFLGTAWHILIPLQAQFTLPV